MPFLSRPYFVVQLIETARPMSLSEKTRRRSVAAVWIAVIAVAHVGRYVSGISLKHTDNMP